jgi:isoquinoline 1-oxidoreductase subunit beta
VKVNRRTLLKAGAAVGGGLLVGVWVMGKEHGEGTADLFAPNAYVRIPTTGKIRVVVGRVEMGQGTATATAMLIAEELEVDPTSLELELAGANRAYDNPGLRFQLTGGSSSTVTSWEPLRQAGASAREMLKEAAAKRWGVSRGELTAKLGVISHPSGKQATYGELAADAAQVTIRKPPLKERDFTVIGKPLARVDAVAKTNGSAVFGIDVQVPDAKVAVIVRPPVGGGSVKSFDAAAAKAMKGIAQVVAVPSGIAVVGETYWYARQAATALVVEWDEGPNASVDSKSIAEKHRALLKETPLKRIRDDGKADEKLGVPAKSITAEYSAPFLAHATMEPQNATAHVTADRCEVWAPTQGPGLAKEAAHRITGLPLDRITIHQTYLGGGFGRRIAQDFVVEAVEVSKAIGGPVKVVWSREDDMKHSFYRPSATHALTAALTESSVSAWRHHVVTQSVLDQVIGSFIGGMASEAPLKVKEYTESLAQKFLPSRDPTSFEGADSMPYAIEHVAVDFTQCEPNVPTGFWRSVGHSHTAFATESFIDECAWALSKDPVELRRSLLGKHPRHLAVLNLAADKAGWGTPAPQGVGRGVAVHESFGSVVACVLEASVVGDAIRVRRVVMASDCGRVVNPDIVRAQLESGGIFGLSAAMRQAITFEKGRVQQSNFHDFALLRMNESPVIETHLVDSEAKPSGIGEPGVPVMAPALANAIYALTQKRLRVLPLSLTEAT